jgi:hypothetical protein
MHIYAPRFKVCSEISIKEQRNHFVPAVVLFKCSIHSVPGRRGQRGTRIKMDGL